MNKVIKQIYTRDICRIRGDFKTSYDYKFHQRMTTELFTYATNEFWWFDSIFIDDKEFAIYYTWKDYE